MNDLTYGEREKKGGRGCTFPRIIVYMDSSISKSSSSQVIPSSFFLRKRLAAVVVAVKAGTFRRGDCCGNIMSHVALFWNVGDGCVWDDKMEKKNSQPIPAKWRYHISAELLSDSVFPSVLHPLRIVFRKFGLVKNQQRLFEKLSPKRKKSE